MTKLNIEEIIYNLCLEILPSDKESAIANTDLQIILREVLKGYRQRGKYDRKKRKFNNQLERIRDTKPEIGYFKDNNRH